MKKSLYIFICIAVFSCNQSENNNSLSANISDSVSTKIDTVINSSPAILDSSTVENYEQDDIVVQTQIIEKTYGKQWDFCDCIQKTDSIQKVIDSESEISDSEFDKIMARFEEIDQHCKAIITSPNTTPEERNAHERRVKKCLRN